MPIHSINVNSDHELDGIPVTQFLAEDIFKQELPPDKKEPSSIETHRDHAFTDKKTPFKRFHSHYPLIMIFVILAVFSLFVAWGATGVSFFP